LDDFSASRLRPLTDDEQRQESDLIGQLQRLDERIGRLVTEATRTGEEDAHLEKLRQSQNALRGQFVAFENQINVKYREFAGAPSSLDEIRSALPPDAALVGWVDTRRHHWACIVRRDGDPLWVPILGDGDGRKWTEADDKGPVRLRGALAGNE